MFLIKLQGLCSVHCKSWKLEMIIYSSRNEMKTTVWDRSEYSPLCQKADMKWTCFAVAVTLAVVAMSAGSSAQAACNRISDGGFLRQSLRIDAYNSPCMIRQDLVIGARATLTVDPGVTLQFSPGVMLAVNGTLIAKVSLHRCLKNCSIV